MMRKRTILNNNNCIQFNMQLWDINLMKTSLIQGLKIDERIDYVVVGNYHT